MKCTKQSYKNEKLIDQCYLLFVCLFESILVNRNKSYASTDYSLTPINPISPGGLLFDQGPIMLYSVQSYSLKRVKDIL